MRRRWLLRAVSIVLLVALAIAVLGFGVMLLWNWLLPPLLGVHSVTFVQAVGILVLCRVLFGGFHGKGGHWRHHRWREVSPEDRARFRDEMRSRWNCRRDGTAEP